MIRRAAALSVLFLAATLAAAGQSAEGNAARSSAAFAEVLLRKTEILADLEAVSADYTDTNPKVVDMRNEIIALNKWLGRMLAVKPQETGKLTLGLGKLIAKRCTLEAELARLIRTYSDEHQEVKRARKRLATFDAAIKELMN